MSSKRRKSCIVTSLRSLVQLVDDKMIQYVKVRRFIDLFLHIFIATSLRSLWSNEQGVLYANIGNRFN
ncbi:hypothetical protein DPMN_043205 [Dreissena polymorpha]|uniref:Uncharacterized protein n=1 Tax=Dreissena polymorpha TaxID=45954 RepID=A0A9D4D024_DREPO|nr:hypothetical protein DPMN_043205 [Dreissena polymorpha]